MKLTRKPHIAMEFAKVQTEFTSRKPSLQFPRCVLSQLWELYNEEMKCEVVSWKTSGFSRKNRNIWFLNHQSAVIKKTISLPLFRRASKRKGVFRARKLFKSFFELQSGNITHFIKSCAEEYASSKTAPLGAFQDHICDHVILARRHKMSPKALPLVNSYDTHFSKIILLLVLISWWQISVFGFYISFSRTCRGGQHHSVIPVACNLTFSKTLTNRNSMFAAAVHLSTSVTISEWTNVERPIIFSRSRVRALNMVVGKFSSPVSCLREKKRALEDLALTQTPWK